MRMFASASEMYMSLPTLPISSARLWISSGGNGAADASAFDIAPPSADGSVLSSTITRDNRICSDATRGLSSPVMRYALLLNR